MKPLKAVSVRKERERAHHFALHLVARSYKREMKSEGCQVKERQSSAEMERAQRGERREEAPRITSPPQHMLSTVRRTKTPSSGLYRPIA